MVIKTVKYSCLILFAWFLLLLVYYSFSYQRADIIIYYAFLASFFFISLIAFSKKDDRLTKYILYVLQVSGFIIPLYGLYNMILGDTGRATGLLGDRVYEADAVAAIFLFLTAGFLIFDNRKSFVFITGAAVFLCATYLLLLKVRTSYVSIFISVLLFSYFIISRKSFYGNNFIPGFKFRTALLAGIILLSLITSYNLPVSRTGRENGLRESVASIFSTGVVSNRVRFHFWDASLKMFLDKPLTGIGAGMWTGTFPVYSGELFNDGNIDVNSSTNPHNDYLEMISEFGFPGLFYLLFITGGFVILFRKSYGNLSFLPHLLLVSCFSVSSFFNFTKNGLFSELLFLTALAIAYSHVYSVRKKILTGLSFYFMAVVLLITASMLITGVFIRKNYIVAMNLKAKGEYGKMLKELEGINEKLFPVDMNGMPLDYYKGAAYYELKDYNKAITCFERAAELMPQYPSVLGNKASALYKTGRINESINEFLYLKDKFPNYIEPKINLLAIYANEKRDAEAVKLMNEIDEKKIESKFTKNYVVFLDIKNYYVKKGL